MKPFVLAYLLLALIMPAAAQPSGVGQKLIQKKCGVERIPLPLGKYGRDFPDLFQQISVMDARPDTCRIGIVRTSRTGQDEITFHSPVSQQLEGYLNAAYSRRAGRYQLLIVLKDLWISFPDSFEAKAYFELNIRFRVEAYVKVNDGYGPLMRFDSSITRLRGLAVSPMATEEIRDLFDLFMGQVAAADLGRDRRLVTYQQIDSFNRARFGYPIDTATRLVKGVYATVDEFRENAPSILNYTIDKDPAGKPELNVADESGHLYFNHMAWGFCDGDQVYVMMDGNLFPVFTVGHQFYVMGSKEYHKKTRRVGYSIGTIVPIGSVLGMGAYFSASATAGVDVASGTTRTLRIFRVDPVTGMITE
jgi:hypothetical protein